MAHKDGTVPVRLYKDMYETVKHIANIEHRSVIQQTNHLLTLAIGNFDMLTELERRDSIAAREHIVNEGRQLGILPHPDQAPLGDILNETTNNSQELKYEPVE